MTEATALELVRQALVTGVLVSLPVLGAGLVVGLVVSIVLAATQIQEFTLTFIPKLVAMAAAGALCAPWILRTLATFGTWVLSQLASVSP